MEEVRVIGEASILDPRSKLRSFGLEEPKKRTLSALQTELQEAYGSEKKVTDNPDPAVPSCKRAKSGIWSRFVHDTERTAANSKKMSSNA